MKSCAEYIALAKIALGNPRMSDADLGAELGFAQQTISKANRHNCTDGVALALGELLARRKVIPHAGEVLVVAHAERDANPAVRKVLADYVGKVLATAAARAIAVVAGVALSASLALSPRDALAGVGGAGGLRRRVARRWRAYCALVVDKRPIPLEYTAW